MSKQTSKLINWGNFDAIPSASRTGVPAAAAVSENDNAYIERVRDAFDRIRTDFDTALTHVSKPFNRVMVFAVVAIALAFAASLALAVYQAAILATIPNLAGAASIFALVWQYRRVLEDQKYLLIPAKYELALTFCHDRKRADKLIDQFLEEMKPHENVPDAP